MKIKSYYASTETLYENVDAYIEKLPENLKRRIIEISDINAKVCSLGGALLLDIAAKESDADVSKVVYLPTGKPYIPQSDFYFSISHTKGYASVSFGKIPSGCDIQLKKEVNLKIAERIYSDMELASDYDDFFKIWCRKESAYKILGKNYCTAINEENLTFKDFMLKDDLYFCVCSKAEEILNPIQIDFDTVF